jgi:hypothetical protein
MMQKFLGVVLLAGIGIALVTGCHSAKKIQSVKKIQKAISALRKDTLKTAVDTTVSIQDLRADSMRVIGEAIGKLKQNRIDFRTFSAKMKVHYTEGQYDLGQYQCGAGFRSLPGADHPGQRQGQK